MVTKKITGSLFRHKMFKRSGQGSGRTGMKATYGVMKLSCLVDVNEDEDDIALFKISKIEDGILKFFCRS